MKISRIPKYCKFIISWFDYRMHCRNLNMTVPSWMKIRTTFGEQHEVQVVENQTFLSTGWAARSIREISPDLHYDIGSDLIFLATVSAFVPTKGYDFRAVVPKLDGISFNTVDLTSLPFDSSSISSLSCLHVVEHVGLGRYGDKLDPLGSEKAFAEIDRVLRPGGHLILAVPIGTGATYFHLTRVFDHKEILLKFSNYTLRNVSFVPDDCSELMEKLPVDMINGAKDGLGCYWFQKSLS